MGKIKTEKRTVRNLIALYCRGNHIGDGLCETCEALLAYAEGRLDNCPFGDAKTACKRCRIHCYKPEMRAKIRKVMRYAGPRMLFYGPAEFFRHYLKK